MPNQQLCPLCNRRKAKRYCSRWDTGICARCCGTNRDSKSCPQGCAYLETAIMELKERTGKLPIYKVLKTDGEGSHSIIVSRKKPNGNLQFISVLVDVWKMGLKDCFGSKEISKLDFHNMVERMEEVGGPHIDYDLSEAHWLIKHGLRIAEAVGTQIPPEFERYRYILGNMDDVKVEGSLYKCYNCGKGELSEEEVEMIKDITHRDVEAGVCGTPGETMIYFTCDGCGEGEDDDMPTFDDVWIEMYSGTENPGGELEIKEVPFEEIRDSDEMDEIWKGFGPLACLECHSADDLEARYFILSRCPNTKNEELWLEDIMREEYDVKHFGILAGVLGDDRAILESAVCRKCGSHDVFFDF